MNCMIFCCYMVQCIVKIYCHPIIGLEAAHNSNKKLIIGSSTAAFAHHHSGALLGCTKKYYMAVCHLKWVHYKDPKTILIL